MPRGNLIEYLNDEVQGLIHYTTISNPLVLGGYGNPRSGYTVFSIDNNLSTAFLVLSVLCKSVPKNILWKVMLNGVTLVREFKPQLLEEWEEGVYAIQVFDVSQLLSEVGRYTLSVKCESSEAVSIESVTIFGIAPLENARTEVIFKAGQVGLKPSESVSIEAPMSSRDGAGKALITLSMPSRKAVVDVAINGRKVHTIDGIVGVEEISIKNVRLGSKNNVTLLHRDTSLTYYPRDVRIHNVLVYKLLVNGPKVSVEEASLSEGKLAIRLRNSGDVIARNVIIACLSAGEIFFRDVINALKPGEEVAKEYNVPVKQKQAIVRVIYTGLLDQEVMTIKLRSES
ncbi:MAG: hypothetical protein J7J20_01015 [Desulfurococcales archaeon]|nr:hypothetical protein [Desulfurococcales archaeon]